MSRRVPTAEAVTLFSRIIDEMGRLMGNRFRRERAAYPLMTLIWLRLTRLRGRFVLLAARAQAGTLPMRRARARRQPGNEATVESKRVPAQLPRGFAWLAHLVPGAGGCGEMIVDMILNHPEMRALLRAAPQAGRILRPLLHMTGADPMPEIVRLPKPRRRVSRAARAKARAKASARAKARAMREAYENRPARFRPLIPERPGARRANRLTRDGPGG